MAKITDNICKLRDILEKNYQEPTKTRRFKYEDISNDDQEKEVEFISQFLEDLFHVF